MVAVEGELPDLLSKLPTIRWFIATIDSVQATEHSVTLQYLWTLIPHTAYLESYTPAVGDVVHVITDQHNGMLVLGKEVLRPATVPVTPPAPISVVSTGQASYLADTAWTSGSVRQGDGWSGAWFYSPTAFTSLTVDDPGQLEIQLTVPVDTGPLAFVLHGNLNTSAPFTRKSEPWLVQLDAGLQWVSLPLSWVEDLIGGNAAGVGLSTDQDVYTATVTGGGTLRFTAL